ncbi:MAG TPA: hypothetical protein VHA74_03220, partial [Candidatus Dojkabacteria bacterium]|nr:hypothetical protein [Candidatus Dojkabacteria bacterium]
LDSQDILQMYTYMNPEKDFGVFLWRGKGRKIEKGIAERGYNKLRDTNKYRIVILTEKDFLDWIDYYIEHGNSNEYIRENIYSKI